MMRTVKDLKCTVEALEKKTKENEEIKEIIKTQKVIEEVLVANSNAIKRIDREIVEITSKKSVPIVDTLEERIEKELNEVNNVIKGNVVTSMEDTASINKSVDTFIQNISVYLKSNK